MMVLVDSSIWVDHLKFGNSHLVELLHAGRVACHPYIILELACGTPPDRQEILEYLGDLHSIPPATHSELLHFINSHQLFGRGCGMVDIALLAATLITPATRLWTADRRLNALAREFGCVYSVTSKQ